MATLTQQILDSDVQSFVGGNRGDCNDSTDAFSQTISSTLKTQNPLKQSNSWSPRDSTQTSDEGATKPSSPVKLTSSLSYSFGSPRFNSEFETTGKLGKGGYGDVFKVRNTLDGCTYAIKRIKLGSDQAKNSRFLREVSALSRLSHPNIVRYYQAWIEVDRSNIEDQWEEEVDESDEESNHTLASAISMQSSELPSRYDIDSSVSTASNWKFDYSGGVFSPLELESTNQTNRSRAQSVVEPELLHCDKCNKVYEDWEVTCSTWQLTEPVFHPLNLCQLCYKSQLEKMGIASEKINIIEKSNTKNYLYIQMEYCTNTLRSALDDHYLWEYCNENRIWLLFREIVEATAYIHANHCIHRDLKPSNIFLSGEFEVKMGDFGLATGDVIVLEASNSIKRRSTAKPIRRSASFRSLLKEKDMTTDIGTMLYRAPELEAGLEYDEKVDIFSLGIILFELWYPFNTGMERFEVVEGLRKHHKVPAHFTEKYPVQSALVMKMTSKNPQDRPSALSLLESLPMTNEMSLQQRLTKMLYENESLKTDVSRLQQTIRQLSNILAKVTVERDSHALELAALKSRLASELNPV